MAVTLIVNPGSSSKKYALYSDKALLLSAYVEKAQSGGYTFCASVRGVDSLPGVPLSAASYHESLQTFIDVAVLKKLIADGGAVTTVALRIVAPGSYFQRHSLTLRMVLFRSLCVVSLHIYTRHRATFINSMCFQIAPVPKGLADLFHRSGPGSISVNSWATPAAPSLFPPLAVVGAWTSITLTP